MVQHYYGVILLHMRYNSPPACASFIIDGYWYNVAISNKVTSLLSRYVRSLQVLYIDHPAAASYNGDIDGIQFNVIAFITVIPYAHDTLISLCSYIIIVRNHD